MTIAPLRPATDTTPPTREDLLSLPLPELSARARSIRDRQHGTRVTYSPKVFIPLTMLCRDRCGYCTFAKAPARLTSPYLTPEQVLAIARAGAAGRLPRGPVHPRRAAGGALPGGPRLAGRARLRLDRRLPGGDVRAGARRDRPAAARQCRRPVRDELATLRSVTASQGMMLESLRSDLAAHRGAPGQDAGPPAGHPGGGRRARHPVHHRHPGRHRREPGPTGLPRWRPSPPATSPPRARAGGDRPELPAQAGHRHAPRTRLPARRLPRGHRPGPAGAAARGPRPGSAQPRPTTSASCSTPASTTGAACRRSPPTMSTRSGPGRRWTAAAHVTEPRGFDLAPRLTIYPEFALDPERWLDPAMRFPVLDRCDAEGLGRDDPARCSRRRSASTERRRRSRSAAGRARARPSGTPAPTRTGPRCPGLGPGQRRPVGEVLAGVRLGQELGVDELVTLFSARGRRWPRWPSWPTSCGPRGRGHGDLGAATATSTTPTSARSSAGSAGSPRGRSRSTCAARPTC